MTFSLAARDPATGAFGMVLSSSSRAVASRCLHLRSVVGAVASQNITNPALGAPGCSICSRPGRPPRGRSHRWLRRRRTGRAASSPSWMRSAGSRTSPAPVRSVGLAVVEDVAWRVTDLRMDDADDPAAELSRLLALWLPQKRDYLNRALDPETAPSYSVAGDP